MSTEPGKVRVSEVPERGVRHPRVMWHALDLNLLATDRYRAFLDRRRRLMAEKNRGYYRAL